MDTEFLGLSFVFILIGLAGIVLFYGPMNAAGDSCYCLIPSPEPGAAQGTASIFLALGLMFFPMGLMKGGLPSFRRPAGPAAGMPGPASKGVSPIEISSGRLLALGIALVILGVDFLLVPGYLVAASVAYEALGSAATALGVLVMYLGLRKPKQL